MTYAFNRDVPIDAAFYARIVEQLGPEPPEGLVIHLAIVRPEGGLRYLDVWESEQTRCRTSPNGRHSRSSTFGAVAFR